MLGGREFHWVNSPEFVLENEEETSRVGNKTEPDRLLGMDAVFAGHIHNLQWVDCEVGGRERWP